LRPCAEAPADQVQHAHSVSAELAEGDRDAILILDEDGVCVGANSACVELLGYSQDVLEQKTAHHIITECIPKPDSPGSSHLTGHDWQGSVWLQRQDGTNLTLQATSNVLRLFRRTFTMLVFKQPALGSDRPIIASRELAILVIHELRHCLTLISGYAELLYTNSTFSENAPRLISAQTVRLERFVDDLLTVLCFDQGKLELKRLPTDLVELAQACLAQLQAVSPNHKLELVTEVSAIGGAWDPGRLVQVLHNLVANAVKYSPGGRVEVRLKRVGSEAWTSVTDEGPGIAATDLERVFEPFYRAVPTADSSGMGLGLLIAKLIIEAHGGSIQVESKESRGSTFSFRLPLAELQWS
jgi:signal transduction histidine kinase